MLNQDEPYVRTGIDGPVVKYIAVVTMFIDHFAYCFAHRLPGAAVTVMRGIGRLAFPAFCLLLVQGFRHTRSVKNYGLRLAAAALLSEIPFDLMIFGKLWEPAGQNVIWTLLLSLGMLYAMDLAAQRGGKMRPYLQAGALAAACAAGWLIKSDYGPEGPALTALLQFLPINIYSGQRPQKGKYFYYIFYPAHMLCLALLRRWI